MKFRSDMQYKTLYETVANSAQEEHVIIVHHSEGTEFEAVSRIEMDKETCQWGGFLVFKDPRFSPDEEEAPGLGLTYQLPGGASGAVAYVRACNYCERLVNLFTALMKTPVATPQPKGLVWFQRTRNGIEDLRAFHNTGYYVVEVAQVNKDGENLWNFYRVHEHTEWPFETGSGWLSLQYYYSSDDAKEAAEKHHAETLPGGWQ